MTTLIKVSAESKGLSSLSKPSQREWQSDTNENRIDGGGSQHDPDAGAAGGETEIEANEIAGQEDEEDYLHEDSDTRQPLTEEQDIAGVEEDDEPGAETANNYEASGNGSAIGQEGTTTATSDVKNTSTAEDEVPGFDLADEVEDDDDLIGYSDDEAAVDDETSRSSTIQGDPRNNTVSRHSPEQSNDAEVVHIEPAEGKRNSPFSGGRSFTVPDDLEFADDSLSASDAFDDEPSTTIAHADEGDTSDEQHFDADETAVDVQEAAGASMPILATEEENVTGSTGTSPVINQSANGAFLPDIEEHDFDFDELVDNWDDDTKEEEPFPTTVEDLTPHPKGTVYGAEEATEVEENYGDDYLDLDDLGSDNGGAAVSETKAVLSAESGSPSGKRTWEEHAGKTVHNGSDQGKYKLHRVD